MKPLCNPVGHFKFRNGKTFDLTSPWSATLVKEDGRWLIVSFHASASLFDNPLVTGATKALYWGCGIRRRRRFAHRR